MLNLGPVLNCMNMLTMYGLVWGVALMSIMIVSSFWITGVWPPPTIHKQHNGTFINKLCRLAVKTFPVLLWLVSRLTPDLIFNYTFIHILCFLPHFPVFLLFNTALMTGKHTTSKILSWLHAKYNQRFHKSVAWMHVRTAMAPLCTRVRTHTHIPVCGFTHSFLHFTPGLLGKLTF
jgi:hypothetical protein